MKHEDAILKNSLLYKKYQLERLEIERHKWFESEKRGYDVGWEWALTDWSIKHKEAWKQYTLELHKSNVSGSIFVKLVK